MLRRFALFHSTNSIKATVIMFCVWEVRRITYTKNCGHNHEDLNQDKKENQKSTSETKPNLYKEIPMPWKLEINMVKKKKTCLPLGHSTVKWRLRTALSNEPIWAGTFPPEEGNKSGPRNVVLQHQTTDKVQKTWSFNCDLPSSESFRTDLWVAFTSWVIKVLCTWQIWHFDLFAISNIRSGNYISPSFL